MAHSSLEVPGLTAHLDRLVHHHGGTCLPEGKPHAFVYFITIKNESDRAVTLLGRKWMILHEDGSRLVIEGDKIVGETPRLAPGEHFSYNSYHVTGCAQCFSCTSRFRCLLPPSASTSSAAISM